MKTLRNFLILIMVLTMTVSLTASLQASADKAETHSALAENGDAIRAICDDKAISTGLDGYFAQRNNEYLDCRDAVNDVDHQNYIRDWASGLSITINSSKISHTVKKILEESDTTVKVLVYEWVMLDYTWHDPDTGEGSDDIMGFGTDHAITINRESGNVENDSYIEITEYEHYNDEDLQYICCEEPIFDDEESVCENNPVTRAFSTYSVAAAVAYSNQWCGQSVEGQASQQNPNNYNPLYYYYGSDCCNFVSQCLYTGGIPMVTGGWHTIQNTGATTPVRDTNHAYSTTSWMRVTALKEYMIGAGYRDLRAETAADCLIGNPIFWLAEDGYSSNHIMLIVDKVGTDTVKINGHNKDAYRFPIKLTDKTYHTIDFVHNYSVQTNSNTAHKYTCGICGDVYFEPHSWVHLGTYYQCTVCGKTASHIITPRNIDKTSEKELK